MRWHFPQARAKRNRQARRALARVDPSPLTAACRVGDAYFEVHLYPILWGTAAADRKAVDRLGSTVPGLRRGAPRMPWTCKASRSTQVRRTAIYMTSPASFDDIEVVREFATSKDGTKVPLNILRKKGVKLDGNNPTLFY